MKKNYSITTIAHSLSGYRKSLINIRTIPHPIEFQIFTITP